MNKERIPQFLRIGEAAKILGVHPGTLRRWEKEGRIKAYRIEGIGERRFELEEILEMLSLPAQEKNINKRGS